VAHGLNKRIMTAIDKNKIRSAFDRAANTYDAIATFQHRVCERLAEHFPATLAPQHILDGGCGTGYGASLLQRRWPSAEIVACDLAPEMVRKTQERGIHALCGDLEHLPFSDARFDFIWSSLALQWCDPAQAYAELFRVLAPGGMLACTTLTTGTLHELDTAFSGIDAHQRLLDFHPVQQTREAFYKAGFTDIRIIPETFITLHHDFRSMLETIRGIGAGHSGQNRRRALMGKDAWKTVQARFETMRTPEGMLPNTYEVLFVFAKK